MTFPASVANLTKAVNEITAETNVPKSTLDAKVAQAEAETPLAQAQQALAEGYRDEAATHAADAATHLATVKAGVTYQGIEAILAEKAVTAVDVFVYDTSLDSDGGAWRKRCQHTSWYNETLNTATRGSRREFPAVAVIVAESNKVTIYDGDDPTLPMWMVIEVGWDAFFNTAGGGLVSGISAKNGWIVCSSTTRSISRLNFISEEAYTGVGSGSYKVTAPVATFRNGVVFGKYTTPPTVFALVSNIANDVAMTVLPDAPIDPATGLPVPTIAVATDGGVSVIKDDGTVVDSGSTTGMRWVSFNEGGTLFYCTATSFFQLYQESSFAADGFGTYIGYSGANLPLRLMTRSERGAIYGATLFTTGSSVVNGVPNSTGGVQAFALNSTTMATSMSAILTSAYNTGWMNGDIKGAFLADTDDTDLVGSGELVTNGAFDTDVSGWTVAGDGTVSVASGEASIVGGASGNTGIRQEIVVPNGLYRVSVGSYGGSSPRFAVYDGTAADIMRSNQIGTIATVDVLITSGKITIFPYTSATQTANFDNISVKLADADRSVNNNGLIVNGTITRSPVADGAELVGYSGFSAANYLEQPYNSALDFGTGDFCVMGWVKDAETIATDYLFDRLDSAGYFRAVFIGQAIRFTVSGTSITSTQNGRDGTWKHLCFVRSGGTAYIYIDGSLNVSGAAPGDVDGGSPTLTIGTSSAYGNAPNTAFVSLFRISAAAPTPDQIAKIYEDERKLFQPGAQCTLYGASDAVTALAHDPKTNLLHVGTSAGRSTFDGLVRVSNTTTPVGTAISAVNGLIVEE